MQNRPTSDVIDANHWPVKENPDHRLRVLRRWVKLQLHLKPVLICCEKEIKRWEAIQLHLRLIITLQLLGLQIPVLIDVNIASKDVFYGLGERTQPHRDLVTTPPPSDLGPSFRDGGCGGGDWWSLLDSSFWSGSASTLIWICFLSYLNVHLL